jgi:polyisoprenoid-binding protein YceI
MKRIALFALAASLAVPALAAPQTYGFEPNHTFPSFSYSHLGYSTQTSRFNKTTGKVVLDAAAHTASVDVTIDMTSVDTGSSLFNQHIQGEELFDTAKYPTATFKSTSVKFDGDKPVSVDGKLTIKDVTLPVTLTITSFQRMVHPMAHKDAIGADAVVKVKRSDFHAAKHVPYVGDEVTIRIAIEAIAE